MGTTAQPRTFVCEWCGKANETRRSGPLNRFCNRWCRGLAGRRRIDNPIRYTDRLGYMRTEYWDDALGRYVHEFEHRRVWREAGRDVPDGYVLHHINEDKSDNRIENLALMPRGAHSRIHHQEPDKYPDGGNAGAYNLRWRDAHPEYRAVHAEQERQRRARRKMAK